MNEIQKALGVFGRFLSILVKFSSQDLKGHLQKSFQFKQVSLFQKKTLGPVNLYAVRHCRKRRISSFSRNIFSPFWKPFPIFIKFQIAVCKPFQFGRAHEICCLGKEYKILSFDKELTLYHTIPTMNSSVKEGFRKLISILQLFILSSANAFNLDQSKNVVV